MKEFLLIAGTLFAGAVVTILILRVSGFMSASLTKAIKQRDAAKAELDRLTLEHAVLTELQESWDRESARWNN